MISWFFTRQTLVYPMPGPSVQKDLRVSPTFPVTTSLLPKGSHHPDFYLESLTCFSSQFLYLNVHSPTLQLDLVSFLSFLENILFMYLFIWLCLRCSNAGSLIFIAVCGIQFLIQGLNPGLLNWEHGVLAPGSPGRSVVSFLECYMTEVTEGVFICGPASFAPCDARWCLYAAACSCGLSACVATQLSVAGEHHAVVTRSLGC